MTKKTSSVLLKKVYNTTRIDTKKLADLIFKKIKQSGKEIVISADELYLAIDEAVTNALEHGNRWDSGKSIFVDALYDDRYLHVTVTDEGKGFTISGLKCNLQKRDVFSVRGRGIFLINKICKPRWNKKGNQIDLQIELK